MKSETRKITEGAMMVAMIGAMLIIDRQMAYALSTNVCWVLSIPIIVYSIQNDRKYSLMVAVSAILVSFFITSLQTVFYVFSALLIGVIYSEGIRKKWSHTKLIIWTVVLTFISYLLSMYVFAGFFGYDLIATRNELIQIIENIEFGGFKLVFLIDSSTLFNVIDITSFMLIVILESLCVHLLSHLVFMKLKLDVEPIKLNMREFVYPKILSILGIVSLILIFVLRYVEVHEILEYIIAFFYLTIFIVNFVYGMIVLRSMRQLPLWCWSVAFILPILWPFVMVLGIMDGLLDGRLRKRGYHG